MTQAAETKGWLVWSNEHGAWWGPNSAGYLYKVEEAGRYTLAEAMSHCHSPHQCQKPS